MKPKQIKVRDNGDIEYRYVYSDLKGWIERGREHGDSGYIILSERGGVRRYACYGTIENPTTNRYYLTSKIHTAFSDPKPFTESVKELCLMIPLKDNLIDSYYVWDTKQDK